jgi:hypothetical protein
MDLKGSMDWFKGKSSPETHGFLPFKKGGVSVKFPVNQSNDV